MFKKIFWVAVVLIIPSFFALGKISLNPLIRMFKTGMSFVPGGQFVNMGVEVIEGQSLQAKVNKISKKQDIGLNKIVKMIEQAKKTKKKVETMYHYKKQSRDFSNELCSALKDSHRSLYEESRGGNSPINPVFYVKANHKNKAMGRDIDSFFKTSEKDAVIKGTRKELAREIREGKTSNIRERHKKSIEKELLIKNALAAKERDQIKFLKERIENLDRGISELKKQKDKEGTTIGDRAQLEALIDQKYMHRLTLDEKLSMKLRTSCKLSKDEDLELIAAIANEQLDELDRSEQQR